MHDQQKIPLGILASDPLFKLEKNLAPLRPYYAIHDFSEWPQYDARTLLEKCRSVEVILTGRESTALPAQLTDDFGRLRYLCHLYGSLRGLVEKAHLAAGLLVTNWGMHVEDVAEGAMALLLCQLKQLVTLNAFTKGRDDLRVYQAYPPQLHGRDVGLYGFGPIGRHMARMLEALGAHVAIYDPYADDVPATIRRCDTLPELFATCQIISIHCGLNAATENSVNGELLALLPQGGILINTARGRIVDEAVLAEHVAAGRLLAGCDVIADETAWEDSLLAALPGTVLTRHQVSSGKGYPPGQEPEPVMPDYALQNLLAYAKGDPLTGIVSAQVFDLKT